jgi:hypothetical protein
MMSGKGSSRDLDPDWNVVCQVAAEGVMDVSSLKAALVSKADILMSMPNLARDRGIDSRVIDAAMARCVDYAKSLKSMECPHAPD